MAALPLAWPETPARVRLAAVLRRAAAELHPAPTPIPPRPLAARQMDEARIARLARLSPQQIEILLNLAGGATRQQIAADYDISIAGASYHLDRIRRALNLEDTTALQFRMELRRYVRYIPPLCDR